MTSSGRSLFLGPDTPTFRSRKQRKQELFLAVRTDKKVLLVPLVVLTLCMSLGLWGVLSSAAVERRLRLGNARNRAMDKAQTIASELRACYLPAKVMHSFVTRHPDFPSLALTFPSLADELMSLTAAGSIANMQLAPLGVLSAIQPLQGSEKAIGLDLLADPRNREFALLTIASHNLTLAGPYQLVQGYMGAPARYPIYVTGVDRNETFGMPADATNCSICYDPATRTKFWGFATVLIHWTHFIQGVVRIDDLMGQGLRYRLTRPDDTRPELQVVLAGDAQELLDPESVPITVPNNVWTLSVADERGWTPSWEWPLVAMVVVLSILLAALIGMAMLARAQQRMLLVEVLTANEQLEDAAGVLVGEKERLQLLLARHYNLIECLGGQPGAGAGGADGAEAGAFGRSSNPADKIERMRKKLLGSLRANHSGKASGGGGGGRAQGGGSKGGSIGLLADGMDIRLGEMIGEGTFGKVYRGLWRGTEVAIKTIVLPANMSGKEKREKMAVMEAAISSSLAHPNVVATYTYQIKALQDSSGEEVTLPSRVLTASAIIVGGAHATMESAGAPSASVADGCSADPLAAYKQDLDEAAAAGEGGGRGIHSYEVQLVLEYCDKGSLKDALDAGIFFGQAGLNYSAILDTAADIAKALLHLHLNDVLHGDLKADNVMLKSSGGEGRGVIAKVADFGLAVKIDPLSTHVSSTFQGTLTHMAPELMLHGLASKAADVFAFAITLWEMFTGGAPYQGVPGALLGHLTSREGRRPAFPPATPAGFRQLAEDCWQLDAAQRPTFEQILSTLTALRADQPSPTPALSYSPSTPEQREAQRRWERERERERERLLPAARTVGSRSGGSGSVRKSTSASEPLPRLHAHYGTSRLVTDPQQPSSTSSPSADSGEEQGPSGSAPVGRISSNSSDGGSGSGLHAVAFAVQQPQQPGEQPPAPQQQQRSGSVGRRRSRSRAKADDTMIVVGGRHVSLSNAITSKSVVLERISETRFEGDPDAPLPGDAREE